MDEMFYLKRIARLLIHAGKRQLRQVWLLLIGEIEEQEGEEIDKNGARKVEGAAEGD